jgi:hypothetical protein
MSRATTPCPEAISTSTPSKQPTVLVERRHHLLVRWSHWLNVPILLGLILSGISIYWASPIYQHKPDPITGNFDFAADIGIWICAHVPALHRYSSPADWVYDHMSLGPGMLAVAWWAGLRFDDLLRAHPPMSHAKWVRVESSVNLDASGNPDPYYVSIDLATARHPQTLLATHLNGQPLTVEHGAPLPLMVPVKLGLKNVKAITGLTYVAQEPRDYWAERGYSHYDGI